MDECLYHKCKHWSQEILTPSKLLGHSYDQRVEGDQNNAEGALRLAKLVPRDDEYRRVRKSQGYKAGKLQPHYLTQLKYKKCGCDRTPQTCKP